MKIYAVKYLELAEKYADKVAARWIKDVKSNAKTPTYKSLDEEDLLYQCVRFYENFSKMFLDERITDDVLKYFRSYARESYAMGIPAKETIYALILMRRHIWLYAEFQEIFTSAIDKMQALDTLGRTILLFDYACYEVLKEYQELMKKRKK
ncbi:MAG: hypothetical protein JW976_15160 [Syntrophaceae bacterium]|nr:hypothetical protein [Syntrophaceae bacterium]